MANPLPSITSLGNHDEDFISQQREQEQEQEQEQSCAGPAGPAKKKKKQTKAPCKGKGLAGIKASSPTIYLLPEEKAYIQRFKATILLDSGEKLSDHELVMVAVRDYAKKNAPEFYKTNKTK